MKLREFCRWILWLLKLSGALIGASFCMGMEAVLFFTLQETWKMWAAGSVQQWQLWILTFTLVVLHAPFLAGALWFTRTAQRVWDSPDKGLGG